MTCIIFSTKTKENTILFLPYYNMYVTISYLYTVTLLTYSSNAK